MEFLNFTRLLQKFPDKPKMANTSGDISWIFWALNEENVGILLEFIKKEPKSSLRYTEMQLYMSKNSIHRILTENLGLEKVFTRFVPHKLTSDQKLLRIQHCKDFIKEEKKRP